MSGLPEDVTRSQDFARYPYWELTCAACNVALFHHRVPGTGLPMEALICPQCGSRKIDRTPVTAWHVRLHDPLKRRRTGKQLPTAFIMSGRAVKDTGKDKE